MKAFLRVLAVSLLCGLPTAGFARDGFVPGSELGDLGACKEDGDDLKSARACTAIIEAKKETTEILAKAYNYRGNAYFLKEPKRALADFNEAIRLNPKNPWLWIRRANLYLGNVGLNDPARAIADFTKVIELRPDLGYKYRAGVYSREKDPKRALADLSEAIKIKPKDMDLIQNRAGIYTALGDFGPAIADYNLVLERDPTYAHGFQERGRAYYQMGDYDEAIADYDQAIKLGIAIQTGLVFYDRGQAYAKKGDTSRAAADYDQAIKIDPGFSAAIIARRELLKQKR